MIPTDSAEATDGRLPARTCYASDMWTQAEAIELATLAEAISPEYGCHVGLTGGCLYKTGPRKDCDLVFYRIRQVETVNIAGLLDALTHIGINVLKGFGFCYKCEWQGKPVDLLFPDEPGGDYQEGFDNQQDGRGSLTDALLA